VSSGGCCVGVHPSGPISTNTSSLASRGRFGGTPPPPPRPVSLDRQRQPGRPVQAPPRRQESTGVGGKRPGPGGVRGGPRRCAVWLLSGASPPTVPASSVFGTSWRTLHGGADARNGEPSCLYFSSLFCGVEPWRWRTSGGGGGCASAVLTGGARGPGWGRWRWRWHGTGCLPAARPGARALSLSLSLDARIFFALQTFFSVASR
jgi:hypothetical protein